MAKKTTFSAEQIEAKRNEAAGFAEMATRAREAGNETEASEAQALADAATAELEKMQGTKPRTARAGKAGKAASEAPQAGAGEGGATPPQEPPKAQDAPQQQQAGEGEPKPPYIGKPLYRRDPRNTQLSGGRLLSHTVAYILLRTGGKAGVPMPEWVEMIGSSALAYHKKLQNVTVGPTGAPVLTDKGAAHFSTRKGNEAALIETYRRMMETGELPEGMMGEQHPPIKR